jgi:chromosome segregation and condensation protein ScpB
MPRSLNGPGGTVPQPPERIIARVAELRAKPRLNRREREELAILTYEGPVPRRVAWSDEVPF